MRQYCLSSSWPKVILLLGVAVVTFLGSSCLAAIVPQSSSFRVGFYNQSCPQAESIVRTTLINRFTTDITAPARLIRLLFHECFVTGCDGSLLVNSTTNNQAEKDSAPNLNVGGYGVVDAAKASLERVCPGIVSCADIEVLLARDAVALLGGPIIIVPTGRLDSRKLSVAAQAATTIPGLSTSASQMITAFAAKGLTTLDMVTLLGAHTVGVAFCRSISYRLYNFRNTNRPDATIDSALLTRLKKVCPQAGRNPDPFVPLDQGNNSINLFDSGFYQELLSRHAILEVDQAIAIDPRTSPIVSAYAAGTSSSMNFNSNFAAAFLKLSSLDVLTGNTTSGTIRTNCARIS